MNVHSLLTRCSRSIDAGALHLALVDECATDRHLAILSGLLGESRLLEQVRAVAASCTRRLTEETLDVWNELTLGLLKQQALASQPQHQLQPPKLQLPSSRELMLQSSGHGVTLRQLQYILARLVQLDACIERFGQQLLAQLLRPLMLAPGAARLRISLLDARCLGIDGACKMTPPAAAADSVVATAAKERRHALRGIEALCEAFESGACALLAFFEQYCGDSAADSGHADADAEAVVDAVLTTRPAAIIGRMGQAAWPALAQMVWDACSAFPMPCGATGGLESGQEDQVAQFVTLLEKRVMMAGLTGGSRLRGFVARLHAHAVAQRANALLDSARALLRSRCADTELGCQPRVGFHRSQCSKRVLDLAQLQRDAVKLACTSDAAGAELLSSRARDMLDLFMAVVVAAAARGSLVVTAGTSAHNALGGFVPQTALFLHNDCQLLARACLSLGAEYATSLPTKAVSGDATFVDLAPEFQWVATQQLYAAIDALLAQLLSYLACVRDLIGHRPSDRSGLGVGEDGMADMAAKQALKQLLHALRCLRCLCCLRSTRGCIIHDSGGCLHCMLPNRLERRLLGALVEGSVRATAGACLSLTHISDADSTALYSLLDPVLDAAIVAAAVGIDRGAGGGNGIRSSNMREDKGSGIPTGAGRGAGPGFGVSSCEGDGAEGEKGRGGEVGGEEGGEEGGDEGAEEGAVEGAEGAARWRREHVELLAPSVAKLRQLLLVLDAEFSRILELHCAGELCMLAPHELLSLLNALFDSTALRGKQAGREFVLLLERCCGLCMPASTTATC